MMSLSEVLIFHWL